MIKLRKLCTKCGFQAWGKVQFFWAVMVPILVNRKDVVTFILGNLSPIFFKCVCFESCDGFSFRVLRKTDQKTAKNDLE